MTKQQIRDKQAYTAIKSFEVHYNCTVTMWEANANNVFVAYVNNEHGTTGRCLISYETGHKTGQL